MEIRRTITSDAITSDNQVMQTGKTYIFDTSAGCLVGIYKGLTPKRALMFDGLLGNTPVTFNVMPTSIFAIYEGYAEIKNHDESEG